MKGVLAVAGVRNAGFFLFVVGVSGNETIRLSRLLGDAMTQLLVEATGGSSSSESRTSRVSSTSSTSTGGGERLRRFWAMAGWWLCEEKNKTRDL